MQLPYLVPLIASNARAGKRSDTVQRDADVVLPVFEDSTGDFDDQTVRLWIYDSLPDVRDRHVDGRLVTNDPHQFVINHESNVDCHVHNSITDPEWAGTSRRQGKKCFRS